MERDKNIHESEQDCWRRIGIWGAESTRCEKLKFVKHCRNCDVFEQAARVSSFERRKNSSGDELSIDELIEKETLAGNKSVMPFRVNNLCFAIASSAILTISDQVAIHSIPHNSNPVIKGLVAINHEVYTFISLRRLLNLDQRTSDKNKLHSLYKRTLVVDLGDRTVVFYVDEVYQIHRYFEKNILPGENSSGLKVFQGELKNKGDWCSDCYLLDLNLLARKLEATSL